MQTRGNSSGHLFAQEITELRETGANLQIFLEEQKNKITVLEGQAEHPVLRQTTPPSALKRPPIPVFTGRDSDCTSTKIKPFVPNVIRVARLSNNRK